MNRPDRTPDFTWNLHKFWIHPEMITYNSNGDRLEGLLEIDGHLNYLWGPKQYPDKLRDEIQDLYLEYIVEHTLLLSETESKNT